MLGTGSQNNFNYGLAALYIFIIETLLELGGKFKSRDFVEKY